MEGLVKHPAGILELKPVELEYLPDPTRQKTFRLKSEVEKEVGPGQCVLLRGDNGTGKSTFLDYLSGRRRGVVRARKSECSGECVWRQDGRAFPPSEVASSVPAAP